MTPRRACLLGFGVVAAAASCGRGGDSEADGGSRYFEVGECAPPAGSTPLAVTPIEVGQYHCFGFAPSTDLTVIDDADAWAAATGSCEMALPAGFDFTSHRLALIHKRCMITDWRFGVDHANTVVLGIYEVGGGACIESPILVPLPRDGRAIRLARCMEACEGECPPRA
jgi:hypothetical protein